jgi:putative transposase
LSFGNAEESIMRLESPNSAAEKRLLIDTKHPKISVVRQCRLLGLSHSSLYYQPVPVSAENLTLMRLLDEEYTRHPFLGVIKPEKEGICD